MTTKEEIAFIYDRARMGWSRTLVADVLGYKRGKFRTIISAMPDIKWPAISQSITSLEYFKTRKGVTTPAITAAMQKAQEVRIANRPRYTVGGFTGTKREIYDHWAEYAGVSWSQFRKRIDAGHDVFIALFMTNQTHKGWGNMPLMDLRHGINRKHSRSR